MQPVEIKNKLIEELTGKSPNHKTGMIIGFLFSGGILTFLGAGIYSWFSIMDDQMPSPGGVIGCGLGALLIGFVLGGIGKKLGWLDSEIDQKALAALTMDEEDIMAEYGFKDWNYDERREREIESAAFVLATFQFLFGTLWSCFEYLFLPDDLPEEGLRAATAVLMYLQQSGRTSQSKLTSGLAQSGLPEPETRRGLAFLKTTGLIVGNEEGFLLTKKAQDMMASSS